MDSKVWNNLHEDFWIAILLLAVDDYRYLESISLVSRQFLSITNQLRRTLTVTNEVIPFLPNLLCRFPNIDEINIPYAYFDGDLDGLLRQISSSSILLRSISLPTIKSFPIEALRQLGSKMGSSLRIFNCLGSANLKDDDLVAIATTFPYLQELDLSGVSFGNIDERLSDAGIRRMSVHLKELRKINLSGINSLTDQSITWLSSNCLLLEELRIPQCKFTMKGIGMALRDCHHLTCISATLPSSDADFSSSDGCFFSKSLAYATNLRELDLDFRHTSPSTADAFLSDLAEANLPLEKLKISAPYATYQGISNLLHKYCSLVSFDFRWSHFLKGGQNVADISKFLKNLTFINLDGCFSLKSSAFFTIIKSCPFLSNIRMWGTDVGGMEEFDTIDFAVNRRVKKLGLSGGNRKICDEFLKQVAFTCPNLQHLDLAGCRSGGMTVEGINAILRNCHELQQLDISWCGSITEFSIDIQLPNLQVLRARNLFLLDESLEIIGERCNELLHLDLEDCRNMSGYGVTEVVKKCQKLRTINLGGCDGVNWDTIFSLVSLGSSLRKIKPPRYKPLTETEKLLFPPHTCQLVEYLYLSV